MVKLSTVKESNALIPSTVPKNPVAVFVGGTKGIGAYALLAFAKYTAPLNPRIYVIARSPSPAVTEAQSLCPKGSVTFLRADASLMKDADRVCAEVRQKEDSVNLLFMSQGTLDMATETSEGLPLLAALAHYSRIRFAQNLLPALQKAQGLRRVVNVLAGTKEGPVDADDWHLKNVKGIPNPSKLRGHGASMLTMSMETLSREAKDVGFVHSFPGFVNTDIANSMQGLAGVLFRTAGALLGRFFAMSGDECGERQVFNATSSRFDGVDASGVQLAGVDKARGTDGVIGSGSYAIDENNENGSTDDVLAQIRQDGSLQKMWEFTKVETERALNSKA